jgi:hypothetical protein
LYEVESQRACVDEWQRRIKIERCACVRVYQG